MDTGKHHGKDLGHRCKCDTHQSRKIQKDLVDYSNSVRIAGKCKSWLNFLIGVDVEIYIQVLSNFQYQVAGNINIHQWLQFECSHVAFVQCDWQIEIKCEG